MSVALPRSVTTANAETMVALTWPKFYVGVLLACVLSYLDIGDRYRRSQQACSAELLVLVIRFPERLREHDKMGGWC